ncbi:MAG: carboxypeptidase regulatory-like domain-containing protein [Planctomycetes bacterium]|nr:carboxypeptidase regulatory-like domain-containing protein [Planctomycetota bacterium]
MRAFHLLFLAVLLLGLLAGLWWFLEDDAGVRAAASADAAGTTNAAAVLGLDANEPVAGTSRDERSAALAEVASTATGAPTAKPERTPALRGRVLDGQGAPVPGARVWAAPGGNGFAPMPLDLEPDGRPRGSTKIQQTETDAQGGYRFEGIEKGSLRLAVRAHGFAPRSEERWTATGEPDQALPDLVLVPGAVITGHVRDRAGAPVVGAELLASLSASSSGRNLAIPGRGIPLATSGADGAFRIDELAVGPFRLIVDAPGFLVREEEGRTTRAGAELTDLVVVLEPGFEIHGRVRSEGPLPAGLRISARRTEREGEGEPGGESASPQGPEVRARHATCGDEGVFVLRGLLAGASYRLTATVPGAEAGLWKRAPGIESVVAQAGQRGVELLWKPETALVFQVVDAVTRAPLTELDVWAGVGRERSVRDEKGEAQKTFADGRVRCGELRPQAGKTLHLRVRAPGHKDHEDKSIVLEEGSTRDLGVIALERERELVVRVLDAATSKPIVGARVLATLGEEDDLRAWEGTPLEKDVRGNTRVWGARTDDQGVARLTGAPGKTVRVSAGARGYLPCAPKSELLPPDADAALELQLAHGGTVVVRVADAAGRPVQGVGIAHRSPGADLSEDEGWTALSAEAKTDAQGLARFENLAPGVHGFCVHDEVGEVWVDRADPAAAGPQWVERNVLEGSAHELAFVAAPRGELAGRVREGGRPLEGAQVRLTRVREGEGGEVDSWGGPQDPSVVQTDHEGEYRYEAFRCGEYWLTVHHASRRMGARLRVTIAPEPRRFDVDLDVATIEGTILDTDGQPIAGVEVVVSSSGGEGDVEAPYQIVVREDDRGNTHVDYEQATHPSERTDARGRYVLRGLATGRALVVSVQSDLVESASSGEITLAPDEVKTGVDFRLRRAGSIQVALTGASARQDSWYEVRAFRLSEGQEEFRASTWIGAWNRSTTLRGLAPGHYKLVLAQPGRESAPGAAVPTREVEVRAQETAQVSFEAF